jgi:flagella basal body P-ring formation protein FlgA
MRILAAAVAVLLALGAQTSRGATAGRIVVGPAATVVGATVTLADVATLEGDATAMADLPLGPAPAPGTTRRLDGRSILRKLQDAGLDAASTRYAIPAMVRVERAAQEIPLEELEHAVEDAAPSILAPGERVRTLEITGPVRVPLGAYELSVAAPPAGARGSNRRLDIDVIQEGQRVASVPVRARLEARGPVVVTRRPVARGAMLQADDLAVEERDLGGSAANAVAAPEAAIGMQTRVPLAAGTPLTFQALESPLLVRRGDVVTVVVETPGMRLSVAGEAQEEGAAGDPVRVLNRKSQQEMSGRVIDRGVVLVQY